MAGGRCAGIAGRVAGGCGETHEDSQFAHDLVAEEKFAGVVGGFNSRLGLLDAYFGGRSGGGGFHFGDVLGGVYRSSDWLKLGQETRGIRRRIYLAKDVRERSIRLRILQVIHVTTFA